MTVDYTNDMAATPDQCLYSPQCLASHSPTGQQQWESRSYETLFISILL